MQKLLQGSGSCREEVRGRNQGGGTELGQERPALKVTGQRKTEGLQEKGKGVYEEGS